MRQRRGQGRNGRREEEGERTEEGGGIGGEFNPLNPSKF